MSAWTKEELEQMLEDVINELDLSHDFCVEISATPIPPAKLVRMVLDQKDMEIRALKADMKIIKTQN